MANSEEYRKRVYGQYIASHETYRGRAHKMFASPFPHLIAFVKRYFPTDRNARILDIGCGSGDLLIAARHAGYVNAKGVDGAADQVRLAHARGLEMVTRADVSEYLREADDGSLDCIIAYDLLEHLNRNELFALCDLIFRKLVTDGRLVIHAPNAEGLFGARIRYGDLTHELAFTPASLAQLWRLVGFSSFRFYADRPTIHSLTSALRYLTWLGVESMVRVAFGADTGRLSGVFTQNLIGVAIKAPLELKMHDSAAT